MSPKRLITLLTAIFMVMSGFAFIATSANAATAYSCGGNIAEANTTKGNQAPVLMDDELSVVAGQYIDLFDVLANDIDPDGDFLTIVGVECPPKGYAGANAMPSDEEGNVVGNGTLFYSANTGTQGVDSFKVAVSDGGFYRVQTVTVTIEKVVKAKISIVKKNKKFVVIKVTNPNSERTLRVQAGLLYESKPDTKFNLAAGASKKFRTTLDNVDIIVDTRTGAGRYDFAYVQYKSLHIRGERPNYGYMRTMRPSANSATSPNTWGK